MFVYGIFQELIIYLNFFGVIIYKLAIQLRNNGNTSDYKLKYADINQLSDYYYLSSISSEMESLSCQINRIRLEKVVPCMCRCVCQSKLRGSRETKTRG